MANIQLAYNLKRYRTAYNYTQQKLADKISISRQAYSNYEIGKRVPDLDLLAKLCDVYSITLDELVRQPYAPAECKDPKAVYHICYRHNMKDILYLTDKEIEFVLEYRGAEWEKQYLIAYVLDMMNRQDRESHMR